MLPIWSEIDQIDRYHRPPAFIGSEPVPRLVEHIDAVARQVGRDVLYVTFFEDGDDEHWEDSLTRQEVIGWLDANGYAWRECGEIASDRRRWIEGRLAISINSHP